ncbi:MAG: hypothetical protein KDC53_17325, partial [Saprospiraceae bacterium]|nr:hypothetical protein [Saprospiraceae bacterium]
MPPFWYVLFSFAAAIGIFLGIISFIFSFKRRANIYLSLLVFSWSAIIIQSILFWTGQLYIYPHFTRLYLYLQFLIAPIPFLYLRSLEPTEEAGGSDFKHFIPFLIVAFNFLPYY